MENFQWIGSLYMNVRLLHFDDCIVLMTMMTDFPGKLLLLALQNDRLAFDLETNHTITMTTYLCTHISKLHRDFYTWTYIHKSNEMAIYVGHWSSLRAKKIDSWGSRRRAILYLSAKNVVPVPPGFFISPSYPTYTSRLSSRGPCLFFF